MNSVITFLRNNYQFILGLVALGTVIVGGGTFVWNKIDSRYIRTDDFNHTQSETNNIITFIYAKETRCLFLESKWTDIYNFQLKRHPNGKILYRDLPPETAEQVRTLKQHIDFLRKDIEEDQEAFKMYCEKNNQSFRTIYKPNPLPPIFIGDKPLWIGEVNSLFPVPTDSVRSQFLQ